MPLLHLSRRLRMSRRGGCAIGSIAVAYAVGIGTLQVTAGPDAHAGVPVSVPATTLEAPVAAVAPPPVPARKGSQVRPAARAARSVAAPVRAVPATTVQTAVRAAPSAAAVWAAARARHRPLWAAAPHPVRHIDCRHLKCIALTFDDGPGPGTTDDLLQILAREHVRATFFVIGKNVAADPGPLIRAAWDGHDIGIHTWDHRNMLGRGTADLAEDLSRTSAVVARYSGFVPSIVRPPFGSIDPATAARIPYPVVLWSVDPDDWRVQSRAIVHDRVTATAAPGSVVLLHDVYRESIRAVPKLIAHYRKRGYTFVSVSELFQRQLTPHRIYRGREAEVARARAADRAAGRLREPYVAPELRVQPPAKPAPRPTPTPSREAEQFATTPPTAPGSRRP